MITKAEQGKIEAVLKKINYRLYQTSIALASHDRKRIKQMAGLIQSNGRILSGIITGKKKKKTQEKAVANGKRESNKRVKKGNKKTTR